MALYRQHRGSLSDSLKTTVIVRDIDDLADILECSSGDIKIEAYPDKHNNFDYRIGWYTHVVQVKHNDSYIIFGFLSENLED